MTISALRSAPSDVKCRPPPRPITLATTLGPGHMFSTRGCDTRWAIHAAHREGRPPLDPRFLRRGVVCSAVAATAAAADTSRRDSASFSKSLICFYICPPHSDGRGFRMASTGQGTRGRPGPPGRNTRAGHIANPAPGAEGPRNPCSGVYFFQHDIYIRSPYMESNSRDIWMKWGDTGGM